MKVIVCLDNAGGMAFNRRRQSRDRNVISDIMDSLNGEKIYIGRYSGILFEKYENVVVRPDFLSACEENGTAFVEDRSLAEYISKIDTVVTYLWNRDYPSDRKIDLALEEPEWELVETKEFAGSSHAIITKNTYVKGKTDVCRF